MFSFYTPKIFKTFCLFLLSIFFLQVSVLGQATFRITKPITGTTQICSSSSNYNNSLTYAFSSDLISSSGNSVAHSVEISNINGLIPPTNVNTVYPSVNVIYTGYIYINGLNLPSGSGYRIRIYSSSPLAYSDYSESFSVLESPALPTLDVSGNVTLCPNTSQSFTITNPNNANTYQWQNNLSNISNATGISYNTSLNGSYTVKATGSNGCSITSNSVYVSQTSLLNSSIQTYGNNSSNYYSPFYLKSEQSYRLTTYFNGGKPPYNFTLNDGNTDINETNISYSKEYNLIAPSSGSKTYTIKTLIDACGTQLSNTSAMVVRINNTKYCAGTGRGTSSIKNFTIQGTTINNVNSGKASDGWGEYLNPANINANQNYNFSITSTIPVRQHFAIWADLNQNGDFEISEKVFPNDANYTKDFVGTFTGILKLPTTTFNGQTRLRVVLGNYNYDVFSCGSSNGETEDYVLNVFNATTPTVIVTDSLPRFGVCFGSNFPVNFQVLGTPLPANTTYKVEVSNYENFSYKSTLATGTNSPIICNITTLPTTISFYSPIYLRVVPTTVTPSQVINNAPNQLKLNYVPSFSLNGFVGAYSNYPYNLPSGSYGKNLQVTSSISTNVIANISSNNLPAELEMSDGRIFTTNNSYNTITVERDLLLSSNRVFKIVRVSDKVCTNTLADSITVSVGIPSLKIIKAKSSNVPTDTVSINKLCGSLYLLFEGKYIDDPISGCIFLQISDASGNFDNPTYVTSGFTGYYCPNPVGSNTIYTISCTIDGSLGLPNGNGYRIRLVRRINGNITITSPTFPTLFELINPAQAPTVLSISKSTINEGEATTLSATFNGGIPPYGIAVDYPYYLAAYYTNTPSLNINLNPIDSKKYPVFQTNGCGYFYETSLSPLYVNVRTLDRNNSQWYVKPYQPVSLSPVEILRVSNLISGTDTLFKRPFSESLARFTVNGYYDYNSDLLLKPTTILRIGANYSFHQIYNTSYAYYNTMIPLLTGIWIDLNQDGDFEDAGEELAKTPINTPWNNTQIQNFTIPINANVGFTRLRVRVAAKDNSGNATINNVNASNPINIGANTFDIPVVLFSNSVTSIISTPKITGNTLCNGNSFYIEYAKYGIPNGTNAVVQLSDVNGNFSASSTVIGQGTSSAINVTLPMNLVSGNYSLRIVCEGVNSPPSPPFNVTANTLLSMVDGDWHAGSTWSCGRIPTYVDDVTVSPNTTVTVFSGDARVGSIITNGVLSFLNGTTLRFNQP